MLDSLLAQTVKDFEVILVEDGSTDKCDHIIPEYDLDVRYFFKENTGPGDSRNFGMEKAIGEYFLFFDSDCVLPQDYFKNLNDGLDKLNPDAFGGPDAAHASFSLIQKAINYSMTSFFTTGGIRGRKKQLVQYQPRSFNMGLSRGVHEKVGGFADIHPGEDPDLSFRILDAGFKVSLIEKAKVYHKRRISFSKFALQVYKFGVVRVILNKWHPKRSKLIYFFPTLFLFGVILLLFLGFLVSTLFFYPLLVYSMLLFLEALLTSRSLVASVLAVPAAFIQLFGYGFGFLKSWIKIVVLKEEEQRVFPTFFFRG